MGDPALQRAIEDRKIKGAHYTPSLLADFVAKNILVAFGDSAESPSLRILDPAVGDGELLASLLNTFSSRSTKNPLKVFGFDTSREALAKTALRLKKN
jgi:type I restriction-modification system DNA methylase subunit